MTRADYERLGRIMLDEAGEAACIEGYGTTQPAYVGLYALRYGDMNADGSLN